MPKKHLLIGCGTAGMSALKQIRLVSEEDSIRIVTMENCLPYSPTVLPYLISGKIEESKIWLADREYFSRMKAELLVGRRVVAVHPNSKEVVYENGQSDSYDTLLIATGSEPVTPAIVGATEKDILVFHTLKDCQEILRRINSGSDVIIYGGGLVAVGLLQALINRGLRVKLIVRSRILRRYFDDEAGALITDLLCSRGAQVFAGQEVTRLERKGKSIQATLSDGTQVSGNMFVSCLGTTPRVSFIEGSGIAVEGGIIVDNKMRTNKPDIYAAGDVAIARDFIDGKHGPNAILPSAAEQGKIAGMNMAGQVAEYDGWISMNVFRFFGNSAYSVGHAGEDRAEVMKDGGKKQGWYKKLVLQGGQLVGAQFVNVEADPGVIVYLIRNRLNVDRDKELLFRKPGLMSRWLMARNERK